MARTRRAIAVPHAVAGADACAGKPAAGAKPGASELPETSYRVEASEKFDALCVINLLSDDAFYARCYPAEHLWWHECVSAETLAAARRIKRVLKDEGGGDRASGATKGNAARPHRSQLRAHRRAPIAGFASHLTDKHIAALVDYLRAP